MMFNYEGSIEPGKLIVTDYGFVTARENAEMVRLCLDFVSFL
jgi:hypothetical protein